jgi:hypothetical protein
VPTVDPDARWGWATQVNNRDACYYAGYEAHLAVLVPEVTWAGDPESSKLGERHPAYILGAHVTPAGDPRGDAGLETIRRARAVAAGIDEVIADRGYTMLKPESFLRPLHEMGVNVVMDYSAAQRHKWTAVTVTNRGRTESFGINCGVLFHRTLPPSMERPSGDPKTGYKRLEPSVIEELIHRARVYRWSQHSREEGGAIRFKCPLHAGRAANADLYAPSIGYGSGVCPVDAPSGMSCCCGSDGGGTFTVPVEYLDTYQTIPWGTPAFQISYGRRNQVESVNGRLKSELHMRRSWLRAFGLGASRFAWTVAAVAYNLMLAAADPAAEGLEDGQGRGKRGETDGSGHPLSEADRARPEQPPPE